MLASTVVRTFIIANLVHPRSKRPNLSAAGWMFHSHYQVNVCSSGAVKVSVYTYCLALIVMTCNLIHTVKCFSPISHLFLNTVLPRFQSVQLNIGNIPQQHTVKGFVLNKTVVKFNPHITKHTSSKDWPSRHFTGLKPFNSLKLRMLR